MRNMIKILKNTVSDEQTKLRSCEQLEKDSWINLIHPTNEEIKRVASEVGIDSHMISQVLVEKELPRIKKSDNAVLVVIDIPYTKDKRVKNKYITYPLGIILSDDSYIVTVSLVEHEFLKKIEEEENTEFFTDRKVRFLIQMLLKSAEVYLSTLNLIDEDIQKVEKSTYYSTNNKQLLNFLNIQKTLVYFITSSSDNSLISAILFTTYFRYNELFLECFSNGCGGRTGLSVSITILSIEVILTVSCISLYLVTGPPIPK